MGEIINFLIRPENIGTAFDIYEHFPSALDELHINFWPTLLELIQKKLREEGLDGVWCAQLDQNDKNGYLGTEDTSLGIYPCLDNSVFWGFWIEQQYNANAKKDKSATISYGFGFYPTEMRRRAVRPEAAQILIDEISHQQDKPWIEYPQQMADGWVALKSFEFDLRSRESMIQLAKGDELEQRVANELFDNLFVPYRPRLEEIKRRLAAPENRAPRRGRR